MRLEQLDPEFLPPKIRLIQFIYVVWSLIFWNYVTPTRISWRLWDFLIHYEIWRLSCESMSWQPKPWVSQSNRESYRCETNFIVSFLRLESGLIKGFQKKMQALKGNLRTKFICSHGLSWSLLFVMIVSLNFSHSTGICLCSLILLFSWLPLV